MKKETRDEYPELRGIGHFPKHPTSKHEHHWLMGTENAVCSECGITVPKKDTHLVDGAVVVSWT